MEESDSDSDPSPDSFPDISERYTIDGKFMSYEDKEQIMAMPEIQREQVLAERAQEVERDKQNRALRNLIHAREVDSKKQEKKRKAGAADLEEGSRKTSRQRTKLGGGKVGETLSGIDSLKKARAEKNDRQRRRDAEQSRNLRKIAGYKMNPPVLTATAKLSGTIPRHGNENQSRQIPRMHCLLH